MASLVPLYFSAAVHGEYKITSELREGQMGGNNAIISVMDIITLTSVCPVPLEKNPAPYLQVSADRTHLRLC